VARLGDHEAPDTVDGEEEFETAGAEPCVEELSFDDDVPEVVSATRDSLTALTA
jgi:hypothetical protein